MADSIDEARARLLRLARPTAVEHVSLAEAAGRVSAWDLRASAASPRYPTSVMDGYAVHAADVRSGHRLAVVGESAAGHPFNGTVPEGAAVRISTGAVVPRGADAVVPQEWTKVEDGRVQVSSASVPASFGPGTFVRAVGSDVPAGAVVVRAGQFLGPGEVALLAAMGHLRVPVRARPQVAILCTGDELVPPGTVPPPGSVVGTNHLMLELQVRSAGGVPVILPSARDTPSALAAALERARSYPVLVTSGGISVGPHDLLRPTLERFGARCIFHGLPLKPGRPTASFTWDGRVVCALPGNPASSFVAFELFVRPLIRAMLGTAPQAPPIAVPLGATVVPERGRVHMLRARWSEAGTALPHPRQASGNLSSLCAASLLLEIPPDPRRRPLPPGRRVRAILLPEVWT